MVQEPGPACAAVRLLVLALYLGAFLWLQLGPPPPVAPSTAPTGHVLLFVGLGLLQAWLLAHRTPIDRARIVLLTGFAAGVAMEVLQDLVGRQMELMDVYADWAGAGVAAMLVLWGSATPSEAVPWDGSEEE